MPVFRDAVSDTTTTTGTGTITLAGSTAVAGTRTISSAHSNADTLYYRIETSDNTEWEVGLGTYTSSGTTLSRDTILASSNSGSAVNFSAGTKNVYTVIPASFRARGTITANDPFEYTQTWNNAGVTFTGLRVNVTNTASASASLLQDWQVGGTSMAAVTRAGTINCGDASGFNAAGINLRFGSGVGAIINVNGANLAALSFGTGTATIATQTFALTSGVTSSPDIFFQRDAAATLAQRNGTNAQTFRIYNTYTDASNYERGGLSWSSNVLRIAIENAGTGSERTIFIGSGSKGLTINPGSNAVSFSPAGGVVAQFGNNAIEFPTWGGGSVFLVGSTGGEGGNSNRQGTPITIRPKGGSGNGAGSYVELWASLATTSGTTAHTQEMVVRASIPATGTPLLAFGGSTSSFPALKRSSTTLQARLADDSAFADLAALNLAATGYMQMTEMTAPSAPSTNNVRIYAEDNGSGKTRLMALFPTGAAQQIAIEP